MKRLLPAILIFSIVGCVTLNKSNRKREAVVAEITKVEKRSKFHMPQIRKPRIINWNNKMEEKEKEKVNVSEQISGSLLEGIIKKDTVPELNENLNEVVRNKRYDNLVELEKKEDQIKEIKESRLDSWMTWVGAIGVLSVFWTGVYFIARNLFYK